MTKVTKTLDIAQSDGWIVASTPTPDRDKDRVFPLGGNLANYQKNPILIFGHNYYEPWAIIGRAGDIVADMASLRIKPELREPASESDPMHIIRALWEQNLLRAASIGFMPIEARENEFGGRDFLRWELLEVSLVPVPANQEAIRMAMKALDTSAILPVETIAKRGRVLSAKNESRIRQATELLSGVLSELATVEESDSQDDSAKDNAEAVHKSQPHNEAPTDDSEPATNDHEVGAKPHEPNELTPEQEAELAEALLALTEELTDLFTGD